MAVTNITRDLSNEDMRAEVVTDIPRRFPKLGEPQIAHDVDRELRSFGEPPIRQYLPLLVSRRLKAQYRSN